MSKIVKEQVLHPKDPGSAFTHFLGMLLAFFASFPLLIKTIHSADKLQFFALFIFIGSMFCLYSASTIYHTFNISKKINCILKKCDHMMIFIMIAGSYTPICLLVLEKKLGHFMLALIWGIAILGILFKAFWVYCPKWVSSVIYIFMGWVCIFSISQIFHALPGYGFGLLLTGGILYTIGGVIYAMKLPIFHDKYKNFRSHEVFHLFVLAGSVCHFLMMYLCVAN